MERNDYNSADGNTGATSKPSPLTRIQERIFAAILKLFRASLPDLFRNWITSDAAGKQCMNDVIQDVASRAAPIVRSELQAEIRKEFRECRQEEESKRLRYRRDQKSWSKRVFQWARIMTGFRSRRTHLGLLLLLLGLTTIAALTFTMPKWNENRTPSQEVLAMAQSARSRDQESRVALLASEAKNRDLTSQVETLAKRDSAWRAMLQQERQRASEASASQSAELARIRETNERLWTAMTNMGHWRLRATDGTILVKVKGMPRTPAEYLPIPPPNAGTWMEADPTP